jgi:3'-5' exoribonuclease
MKQHFVADLVPDTTIESTFLVQSKERRVNQGGTHYLALTLQDSSGTIKARLWDSDQAPVDFEVDDVVRVVGRVEAYDGTRQLKLQQVCKQPEGEQVDLLDYLPRTTRDPEEMYAELLARVGRMPEGPLKSLLFAIFEDPAISQRYKLAPAATSFHHAYLGGLLEHVTSLVQLGDQVCDHYAWLDGDLVMAGLLLHDIGKIEELSFERGFHYSTRGQLLGHLAIGLELVRDKMRAVPGFPAELKDRIEHIILSHHGRLEFGSPKEPMFPEALLVHYLDDLDSKLASMRAQYAADKNRLGDWTNRNRALGRELLKRV